jgi:hypothetical protein
MPKKREIVSDSAVNVWVTVRLDGLTYNQVLEFAKVQDRTISSQIRQFIFEGLKLK